MGGAFFARPSNDIAHRRPWSCWGWFVRGAKSSPYFRISAVRVEHSERVSREDVLHALRLSDQNNYFLFDHIAAEERLQDHDWVAEVEIKKMSSK